MTTFETLSIGDTIFVPQVRDREIEVPCPDCGGSKHWHVSTSKGRKFMIDCPRCTHNGKEEPWMKPKRHEYEVAIIEATIKKINIDSSPKYKQPDEIDVSVRYDTKPYLGTVHHEEAHLTREAAEAAGQKLLEERKADRDSQWYKARERDAQRARLDILLALEARVANKVKVLEEKIDKLKAGMLDAIRFPTLHGPELTRTYSGVGHELTSEELAKWLGELLSEADIEGWTENELHEAMCHC